jgi:hypothetical protein
LDDIESLENRGSYPLIIGNGCETNVFNLSECFAEALLRAPGKGALAYIGCTNDSYWDEDYYWAVGVGPIVPDPLYEETSWGYYDRVFHTHNEPYESWIPSLGEMIFGGNMAVQQSYTSRKKFYWEIYQLAGDPTIIPWFSNPGNRTVIHPLVLPEGSMRLDVTCAPYDYVAVSLNGILLDAVHAGSEGLATVGLPGTFTGDTVDLVVTGQGYRPYRDRIQIGDPEDAYLDLLDYRLSNESVEPDLSISPDEEFSMDLLIINRGSRDMVDDTLVLGGSPIHLEILDSLLLLPDLPAGDTLELKQAFRIRCRGSATDQSQVMMGLSRRGDDSGNSIFIKERIYAPVLGSGGIRWDDRPLGNGNGIPEPGEWLECKWILFNRGHYPTGMLSGAGEPEGSSSVESVVFDPGSTLDPGDTVEMSFRLELGNPPEGWIKAGPFRAGDMHVSVSDSFNLVIGRHFEDFSGKGSGDYSFINHSPSPWRIDQGTFFSSPYAFRSGSISNYGKSELTIRIENQEPGTLSFSCRVSSEPGFDYLRFYVDSVLSGSWSGEKEWLIHRVPLEAGSHEITWAYRKDQSVSRGLDAAWIDDIVFPVSSFRRTDLSLVEITEPVSGPWLTGEEKVKMLIRNTGQDTIQAFSAGLFMDGVDHWRDTLQLAIPPGSEQEVEVPEPVRMDLPGSYSLDAEISVPGDFFIGNNHLHVQVDHYLYPDLSLALSHTEEEKSVFTDLAIHVINQGNMTLDSLSFQLILEETLKEEGTRFIGLDPGETRLEEFRILDSTDLGLNTGYYTYTVRSVASDSVASNNEVTGTLFWNVLGEETARTFSGVLLYPNPAREGFHLVTDRPAPRDLTVELISPKGELLAVSLLPVGVQHLYVPVRGFSGSCLVRIREAGVVVPLLITR